MTHLIGWASAGLTLLGLAGILALVFTTPRRCDCCDHPDLDDVELVIP